MARPTPSRRPLRAAAAVVILGAACTYAFSSGGSSTRSARATAPVRAASGDIPAHLESASATSRRKQEAQSSTLRMICDEQKEFEMALGKAVDTLRKDYPDLLTVSPDFSIYHTDLETVDPSGVKLHGIRGYKTSFQFLHAFVNFFYCPEDSGLTFRLVYDWARNHIRVSWNAVLVPKKIYGGSRNVLHVDGISVYEMNKASGLITQHRIESLVLNDTPVRPVNGIFNAMENLVRNEPEGVPVLGMKHEESNPFVVEFQGADFLSSMFDSSPRQTSLFSVSDASSSDVEVGERQEENSTFDQAAYERKNESRMKFGLPPISVQEFEEIQAQVRQMELAQRRKAAASVSQAAELTNEKEKKKGLLSKMFGGILEDTCESNWDCERPEVCCDLGFKKMCCSSGVKVYNGAPGQYQRALLPIPVENGDAPTPPDAF
eukprot:CAMPEP_0197446942 /NCGR_PEP_ID=MMETSP1175-20131217/11733_1 /TAXON_ID=1003142 /ORGANISM="Triceratium dubium, Strain CCMP147" /LENGTH=432 /DNA_ID=CAMNT_0042978119 /DNA_START=122 /DNA_END=1420 /DNA_ORIENTATION=+